MQITLPTPNHDTTDQNNDELTTSRKRHLLTTLVYSNDRAEEIFVATIQDLAGFAEIEILGVFLDQRNAVCATDFRSINAMII